MHQTHPLTQIIQWKGQSLWPLWSSDNLRQEIRSTSLNLTVCSNWSRKKLDINQPSVGGCHQCNDKTGIKYTAKNIMDPGVVPIELMNLTFIDQMLIAQIHTIMPIFQRGGGAGELHYTGNVMNFRQDIHSYTTVLLHDIEDMTSIIISEKQTSWGLADFWARWWVIKRALEWLKRNNEY